MWFALASTLLGVLWQALGSLVGRVLVSLGIGYVTMTVSNPSMSFLSSYVQSQFAGAPATVVGFLVVLKVPQIVSVLIAAIPARLAYKGFAGGVQKTMKVT